MKHLALLSIVILAGILASAQQTLPIPYQALVRDASGNPLPNKQIGAEISLLLDNINGTVIFTEIHTPTTNPFGQLDLQIGSVETAAFDSIDWSAGKMFIRLAVDITGGTAYQPIATHQLLAVPFAKYAEEAAGWKKNGTGISFMDGNVGIGKQNPALKFELSAPAQSQVAEQIFEISVDDASGDYFRIGNGTGGNMKFEPTIFGVKSSDNEPSLIISGRTLTNNDNGTWPLIIFNARTTSNSVIQNRPLFGWSNYASTLMTMTANGNLGIGTTIPDEKLEVRSSFPALLLTSTTGGNRAGVFMRNTISGSHYEWYAGVVNGSSGTYIIGSYITNSHSPENSASATNAKIAVTHNGFVGIGTTTPARTLHVSDVMRLQPRSSAPSGATMGDIYFNSSTKKLMVYDGTTWRSCW